MWHIILAIVPNLLWNDAEYKIHPCALLSYGQQEMLLHVAHRHALIT